MRWYFTEKIHIILNQLLYYFEVAAYTYSGTTARPLTGKTFSDVRELKGKHIVVYDIGHENTSLP